MMRRLIPAWIVLAIALLLPSIAAAQDVRVSGQVLDRDGKPWAGLTVVIKSDSGRSFTLKTDNNGKFSQIGLTPGVYSVTVISQANNLNYTEKHQFSSGEDNDVTINFKAILAQQSTANPEQEKKKEEAANQFKNMKAHVDAGVAALSSAEDVRKQLKAASADQKTALEGQMKTDYQTAVTELQQAEQAAAANPKDTKNHAIILSDLGVAYSNSGQYDQAVTSYQKAIELNPQQPGYYNGLSSSLANSAAAQTDPAAVTSKIADAGAACDKASALQTPP
ncbi:MAG TPA: carboxypeptidase regulatory-like domain-containing protein, partial [Candidatus Acidoferrales bacterium]|nr:carboxypeptidase regulatory-like domain-containing protein [Candidatus Acidoferrales bacterium]